MKARVIMQYEATIAAEFEVEIPADAGFTTREEAEDWARENWAAGEQLFSEEITSRDSVVDSVILEEAS